MNVASKVEAYFEEEHRFREGVQILRDLAVTTKAEETFKWQSPVYALNGKNVFWISRFKNHFSIGFFNGIFLKDPEKILVNAQKGKTQAMRHLKFESVSDIDSITVLAYMNEALRNQEKGIQLLPNKGQNPNLILPRLLAKALTDSPEIKKAFYGLSPYRQREYAEYIANAKQEKTKLSRIEKISILIKAGKGLNDRYRSK